MMGTRIAVLAMVMGMMGCGESDPVGPGDDGSFALEISGVMNDLATGPAFFGAEGDPGQGERWALVMGKEDSRHVVALGRSGPNRPGPGTYPVTAPDGEGPGWSVVHLVTNGDELMGMFVADQGTVTLTSSSYHEVAGRISFRAVNLLTGGADTVFVSGSFVARSVKRTLEGSSAPADR